MLLSAEFYVDVNSSISLCFTYFETFEVIKKQTDSFFARLKKISLTLGNIPIFFSAVKELIEKLDH